MPHYMPLRCAVAFLLARWSIFGQMSAALVYLPAAEAEAGLGAVE